MNNRWYVGTGKDRSHHYAFGNGGYLITKTNYRCEYGQKYKSGDIIKMQKLILMKMKHTI